MTVRVGTRPAAGPEDAYPTRVLDLPVLVPRADPVVYGLPQDGPLCAADLDGYRTDGFLTDDALFEPDEIERFRSERTTSPGSTDATSTGTPTSRRGMPRTACHACGH